MRDRVALVTSLLLVMSFQLAVLGEVVRFEITSRDAFAEGQSFGDAGPYERIAGKVHFALDPGHFPNDQIVDLDLAPTNEEGHVEFTCDLFILAPKDLRKGNGALLYDVNNRGNKLALRFFNEAPGGNNPQAAGNGFLMRHGFTVVWSGWNGEILPGNARLRLQAPTTTTTSNGRPITGTVRYELMTNEVDETKLQVNRASHGAYRPVEDELENAQLSWRLRPGDDRVPIPRSQYKLHVTESDAPTSDGVLPLVELELPAGFRPGYLYELTYQAQDPLVHGVCFASVRDLVAALKQGAATDNPLVVDGQSVLRYAYGFGVSQSGRFLREMLYSGQNQDELGGLVFDGLMPHVAGGGLGSFNHRFAQPTAYCTQHQLHDWPSDRFPFSYETQLDPLTGSRDGILKASVAGKSLPKIIHSQSSTEYWSRSGSLVHTDPLGTRDSQLPANVRVFAFGGTQHGPASYPPSQGIGQTLSNPGDYRPMLRALLVALHDWCKEDQPAPESIYPLIREGTLVDWRQSSTGFPSLPGVRYPEVIQEPALLDRGSRWAESGIIDIQPPRTLGEYQVLVPRCDADGNEVSCLSPPEVMVPLATFAGWSLRKTSVGAENELVGLSGSYIPLPISDEQRSATGDPRISLEKRYGDLNTYVRQLEDACEQLVQNRYLLAEDVQAVVERQKERATAVFSKVPSANGLK